MHTKICVLQYQINGVYFVGSCSRQWCLSDSCHKDLWSYGRS